MLRPRIIPSLLIHNGGLVKTVGFKDPKYVGDPVNAIKIFNEKEADELIVFDIDATVQNEPPNMRLIAQFAAECRMPLCYGGGIKSAETANEIISLGVEKIAISSAAVEDPDLISTIAKAIGTQSVVVVVDVKASRSGYEVWTHNGKRKVARSLISLVQDAERLGAGEIVVNSIDNDGQSKGYDLQLARDIRAAVHVPISFLGGAGSLKDIGKLIETCGVVGAAAGSLFVFKGPYRAVLISYPNASQRDDIVAASLDAWRKHRRG